MRGKRKGKFAISMSLVMMGILLSTFGINWLIEPNLDNVSRLKAEGMVNEIINETVKEEFAAIDDVKDLFILNDGAEGALQMIQANTVLINQKIADITVSLQKKYNLLEPEKIIIPIGTVFGSTLLSQSKKGVEISVMPLSVSNSDFETGFESQGINQTKYRIYAVIRSTVRVLQPFSQEDFDITTKILLSEVVIVGDVPESYVHVPKEDILDVT